MFRAVPMMQLQILVLARDERPVLEGLGESGAIQLMIAHQGPDTLSLATPDYSQEIASYDRMRTRVQGLRQLLEIPPAMSVSKQKEGFTSCQINEMLQSLERQSQELVEHRQRLVQRQKELATVRERISCFRGFEIPLDGFDQFSFFHFVAGRMPAQNFKTLANEVGDASALLPVAEEKGQKIFCALTTSQGWPIVEKKFLEAGFQSEELPVVEGATVDRLSEEIENEYRQLETELERVNKTLKVLTTDPPLPLAEVEGFIDTECKLVDARQKLPRTEATVLITGWVPAGDVAALEDRIKEVTGGRYSFQATHPDCSRIEDVPVLIRNSRLVRPFEMLVQPMVSRAIKSWSQHSLWPSAT